MKAFNTLTLTTQNSRYGTVATERITSEALTTAPADTRYAGLPVAPRLARTACKRGTLPAGKPFKVTRDGALQGALDSATVWARSGEGIKLAVIIAFDDYYNTYFTLGERVSNREWRDLSSAGQELYNWMVDHARAIRRAVRRAKLSAVEWGKVVYGVQTTLAEIDLTADVGIDRCEQISAHATIVAY